MKRRSLAILLSEAVRGFRDALGSHASAADGGRGRASVRGDAGGACFLARPIRAELLPSVAEGVARRAHGDVRGRPSALAQALDAGARDAPDGLGSRAAGSGAPAFRRAFHAQAAGAVRVQPTLFVHGLAPCAVVVGGD